MSKHLYLVVWTTTGPLIHTKLGALRGEYLRVRGKTTVVHSYLGVPFAKPPVGPLRLAPPQPVQGWEGVRDATKQPPMCLQNRQISIDFAAMLNMVMELPEVSEDCLYLNVYTPAKPAEDAKLPVMVWIHGGALIMGSASFYDGSVLSVHQNVVVVLIQYRLGLMGFFSTGDDNAPGNMGFLDQVAALRWVQENIQSFGGDPSSVTIFGESAGAVNVSMQVLSPLSNGLFHRAITGSGAATIETFVSLEPMRTAKIVANAVKCTGTKPHQIADCVMKMSTEDILKVAETEDWIIDLIVNEYLGSGENRIKNRDGFLELCGDILFIIPIIKLSNVHRDSGAPVYMYELQHRPSTVYDRRPSFVKVDHGDDIVYVFGSCFMKSHVKINATFTEEEDELCRRVMSYWGNFARTGSPNGPGLTHWPMYGAGEEYLGIGLKQQVGSHLRANRFTFMTETLPKKIQQQKQQRSDEL
ncbi:LOW QUALITY PROTEIN: cocaine esterase-like [Alosa sapidissima]|uniref:LOW QUALITY PROTEIN: cocaine esterase-like n=1 Tax=Alosa sapidissima TaxID=34773 RepID=UPI001C0839A7|nr:LOW QUALITY PROTEIN: cocaine esterase-like [Alosa sapidissima]